MPQPDIVFALAGCSGLRGTYKIIMSLDKKLTTIKVIVNFHKAECGGHHILPPDLLSSDYRPHFVVGDKNQRTLSVNENDVILEDYLGVRFTKQEEPLVAAKDIVAEAELVYKGVDYRALKPGATFTIREGGAIIGHGQVM